MYRNVVATVVTAPVVALLAWSLAGCHAVETSHALAEGVTASPRSADTPVDVLEGRPSRPFRSLGTVQVRVDRGTAMSNPTLADAIPALSAEARAIGADAVILTHEEFTSWFDKGEDASPIHDLERQETWYITEKARYVSGVAIAYTGPACVAPMPTNTAPTYRPAPRAMPAPVVVPTPAPIVAPPPPPPPPAPVIVEPPPAPAPLPPPPPADGTTMPVAPTAPSLPEGPIELPPEPKAPDAPKAPEAPMAPGTTGGATIASLPAPRRLTR